MQALASLDVGMWFVLVAGIVLTGIYGLRVCNNRQPRLSERAIWLQHVYEFLPVGVFVERDQKLVYGNGQFKQYSQQFKTPHPFSHQSTQGDSLFSLQSPLGDVCYFRLIPFPLDHENEMGYLVLNESATAYQANFIKDVSHGLTDNKVESLDVILDALQQILPSSLIYVAKYQYPTQNYHYFAHRGDDFGVNVLMGVPLLETKVAPPNHWFWLQQSQWVECCNLGFIQSYNPSYLGGVALFNEAQEPLGLILILQKSQPAVSDAIKDFLTIFSNRLKLELSHELDLIKIKLNADRYREFISRSNDAILDIEIHPGIYIEKTFDQQWQDLTDHGQLLHFNQAFLNLFERTQSCDLAQLLDIKSLKHVIQYAFQSGYGSETLEAAHKMNNGKMKWLSCTLMVDIDDGRLNRLWLIIHDITDSKMHIQRLEHQSQHDHLTGLPNRHALRQTLNDRIDLASQFGFKLALLVLDLDRFKEINDTLGHHYGDVLLKLIAPRIEPLLQEKRAILSRLGGDEFAIVIPNVQSLNEAEYLAKDLLMKIKEPFDLGVLTVEISGSVGISIFPDDGKQSGVLLRCADVAMYQAKSVNGGILAYQKGMDVNTPRRLALLAAMGNAVQGGQFFLCYQPKLHVKEGVIHSAEALIRWQHPEYGLVSPGEFIPLAEMSDVIVPITQWVIDQALSQIQRWQKIGYLIQLAVNVSPRNLLDENLVPYIEQKLAQYQVSPHLLEIEITESALMLDPERAKDTLQKISNLGVSIAVDDFGTGYSSMVYLRQLPVSTLKIDIMFVRNMCIDPQDERMVDAIIYMAKNLSLKVVAEGAEDLQTLERLTQLKCDTVQGYVIAKPLPEDGFIAFIEQFEINGHKKAP